VSVPQASTSIKAYPLEADDWRLVRQPGSHRQFKHPSRPGRVTVAGTDGDEIKPGTLVSILRQAQLKGRGRDRIRGGH
jgi:predicted RNA binding protein YcfA (HicA-like mRNA interferase family)